MANATVVGRTQRRDPFSIPQETTAAPFRQIRMNQTWDCRSGAAVESIGDGLFLSPLDPAYDYDTLLGWKLLDV